MFKKVSLLFAVCVCMATFSFGCLTVEQMAPLVGPAFSALEKNGATMALMQRGREVYVADCTHCHSVEPIGRYSIDRWREIIARMAPQSKLDDSHTAALRAYVFAAHELQARGAFVE